MSASGWLRESGIVLVSAWEPGGQGIAVRWDLHALAGHKGHVGGLEQSKQFGLKAQLDKSDISE